MKKEEIITKAEKDKYFFRIRGLEKSVLEELISSRRRAWFVAIGVGLIAFLSLSTQIFIIYRYSQPLTEHILTVNKDTGEAQEVSLLKDQKSYGEVIDKYWVAQYVIRHNAYDYYNIQSDYSSITLMSSRPVFDEYAKLFQGKDRIDAKYGDSIVTTVTIKAVILSPDKSTAEIRFSTQTYHRSTDTTDAPKNFVATIGYEYQQRLMTASQRQVNPLGFTVTAYRVVEES